MTTAREDWLIFQGVEVEHTPMHGRETVFVVGMVPIARITRWASETISNHIYLGANHSCTGDNFFTLCALARALLLDGYDVTFDFPSLPDLMLRNGLDQLRIFRNFYPMLSLPVPGATYLTNTFRNASLKFDDGDHALVGNLSDIGEELYSTPPWAYEKDQPLETRS